MNDIVFAGRHMLTRNVTRHKHRTWELIYCTGASGKLVFSGLELPYGVGDVAVIPPDTPHENVNSEGLTNIHLNIDHASLAFRQPVVVRDDTNGSLLHLFADAYFLFCGEPERRAALLPFYGDLIVRHVSLCAPHRRNPMVEEIEQSIIQHCTDPNYELDRVLSAMPYCSDYLCRLFREELHTTPGKFLTELRLQRAADMLLAGGEKTAVSEIARLCGFRDPLYFSRMFKKRYQVSPSRYAVMQREEAREMDSDSQKIIAPD